MKRVLFYRSINYPNEETDDPTSFIKYTLGVILACYREFEERVEAIVETTIVEKKTEKQKTLPSRAKPTILSRQPLTQKSGNFPSKI